MSEVAPTTFACKCKEPKKHRLTLDGGPSGNYVLELCASCYNREDKKHVLQEESIS